jgi:hypothetical protein
MTKGRLTHHNQEPMERVHMSGSFPHWLTAVEHSLVIVAGGISYFASFAVAVLAPLPK